MHCANSNNRDVVGGEELSADPDCPVVVVGPDPVLTTPRDAGPPPHADSPNVIAATTAISGTVARSRTDRRRHALQAARSTPSERSSLPCTCSVSTVDAVLRTLVGHGRSQHGHNCDPTVTCDRDASRATESRRDLAPVARLRLDGAPGADCSSDVP